MKVGLSDCAGALKGERSCIYVAWEIRSQMMGVVLQVVLIMEVIR